MNNTKSLSNDQLDTVCGGFSSECKTGAAVGAGTVGAGGAIAGSLLRSLNNGRGFGAVKGLITGVIGGGISGCAAGSLFKAAKS